MQAHTTTGQEELRKLEELPPGSGVSCFGAKSEGSGLRVKGLEVFTQVS